MLFVSIIGCFNKLNNLNKWENVPVCLADREGRVAMTKLRLGKHDFMKTTCLISLLINEMMRSGIINPHFLYYPVFYDQKTKNQFLNPNLGIKDALLLQSKIIPMNNEILSQWSFTHNKAIVGPVPTVVQAAVGLEQEEAAGLVVIISRDAGHTQTLPLSQQFLLPGEASMVGAGLGSEVTAGHKA